MGPSVLITGGAGFLGSHLALALLQRGDRVVIYDNFFTGLPEHLSPLQNKVKFVNGDILDLSFLIRTIMAEKVKRIIHTAALVSFTPSIEKPALTPSAAASRNRRILISPGNWLTRWAGNWRRHDRSAIPAGCRWIGRSDPQARPWRPSCTWRWASAARFSTLSA